jgi:hypothetical protein
MTFLEEVRAKRQKLADILSDDDYSGIREIVEELYPDQAHFIYELLQNAEDQGATRACFSLESERLAFEHDGRPFDKDDVWRITNIGKSAKHQRDDKIGRFGVGFKAVFAYCDTPLIWSPSFSFKITNLVLPVALDQMRQLAETTRFEFPFNNQKKSPENAFAEIQAGLNELAETTLLFLSNLKAIHWRIAEGVSGEVRRIQHSEYHFEVLKQNADRSTTSHFLKFDRPVEGLDKQRVAVAFALESLPNATPFDPAELLAKQMKITPAAGRVAVFFPAEKETSGLRFHLHAPFVPELSRASIKETPANQPLFRQLASLTAAALHHIREEGLLTADFLSVLPNPQEQLPSRYQGIRTAVIDEMNCQPLTPTHKRSHSPASQLLQANASLKDLLTERDIEFLLDDHNHLQWAVGVTQRHSDADRFLAGLAIKKWDIDEFVELLREKTSQGRRYFATPPYFAADPDPQFIEWLSGKTSDWHQKLYSLLFTELSPNGRWNRLKDAGIVRLSDGAYGVGGSCFFPSDGVEADDAMPRVDAAVYTSGRSKAQQENAKKLLEQIGVRQVGEAEEIEVILKKRYTQANFKPQKQDLKRFIALTEKDTTKTSLFSEYFILEGADGKWHKPEGVYLDNPFLDTGLRAYYDALGENPGRVPLADRYTETGADLKRFVKFAESIGVQTRLQIAQVRCDANPQHAYLRGVGGERYSSPINRDYAIVGLERILTTPTLPISQLVWRTMCALSGQTQYLRATFQKSESWGARHADSQLVHHLRAAAWIPQGGTVFVRPKDAMRDLLPDGFPFDAGWTWLKLIGFGDSVAKKSEEQRQKEVFAKELGFADNASLERAKRFAALPPEEQERILSDRQQAPGTQLPDNAPSNPGRRAERVGTKAAEAPERRTEERARSVSIGIDDVKLEAAQYLRQQYTNADGEMICQVCKTALPFKLDDGSDYFEKVEFLPELKRRHYQNYLSLCPNHAAMFQHANGSCASMQDSFVVLTENELSAVLAQKETTIYFTKTHIADLKEVIRVDRAEADSGSDVPAPPGQG